MSKDEVFATIGLIVIETQAVESLLDLILTYVLQDGIPLTYDRIIQIEQCHRRKTLGQFFKSMKARADYSPDLVEVFDRFLENRNTLIHRFRDVEGHELSSISDHAAVHKFLNQLHKDTWKLLTFFSAWIVSWQNQTGIGKGSLDELMPKEGASLLREINLMSGFANEHVFRK